MLEWRVGVGVGAETADRGLRWADADAQVVPRVAASATRNPESAIVSRVVLLGDSIFDNAAYVRGGPDVAAQLRAALGESWKVTLAAVDGAVMEDVGRQLRNIPDDATHLVLSVGGNDALRHVDLLEPRPGADVLARLADAAAAFGPRYEAVLEQVHRRGLPLLACTVYEGNLGGSMQKRAMGAIAAFNDRIQRAALRLGVPVLELRELTREPEDYANPIEPSVQGGEKIAGAVAAWLVRTPAGRGAPPP